MKSNSVFNVISIVCMAIGIVIRPYLWVLLASFLIGYPCSRFLYVSDNEQLFPWRIPLVLLITALVMTLSTAWKIRKIMHTNPTDILRGVN